MRPKKLEKFSFSLMRYGWNDIHLEEFFKERTFWLLWDETLGPCPGEWTIKANYGTTQDSQASPKIVKSFWSIFKDDSLGLSSSVWWFYNLHNIMIPSIIAMQIEKGYINIINIITIYQYPIIFRHLHNDM